MRPEFICISRVIPVGVSCKDAGFRTRGGAVKCVPEAWRCGLLRKSIALTGKTATRAHSLDSNPHAQRKGQTVLQRFAALPFFRDIGPIANQPRF